MAYAPSFTGRQQPNPIRQNPPVRVVQTSLPFNQIGQPRVIQPIPVQLPYIPPIPSIIQPTQIRPQFPTLQPIRIQSDNQQLLNQILGQAQPTKVQPVNVPPLIDLGMPQRPASQEFQVSGLPHSGERFNRVRTLGKGTFGKVELGKLNNGILVARKTFYPRDNDLDQSTLREINSLQLLAGAPFIVQILAINVNLDTGGYEPQTTASILLTYHTSDLAKFSKIVDPLSRNQVTLRILECMVVALEAMHSQSIIHRDIKSQNILVQYEYNEAARTLKPGTTAYLADFGLGSVECPLGGRGPRSSFVYTCIYRPPEILAWSARGKINDGIEYNSATDIWALGASLYEMLSGGVPLINSNNCTGREEEENEYLMASVFRKLNIPNLISRYNDNFYAMREDYLRGNISAHVDVKGQLLNVSLTDKWAIKPDQVEQFVVDTLENFLQVKPEQRQLPPQILNYLDLAFSGSQPLPLAPIRDRDGHLKLVKALLDIAKLMEISVHLVLNALDLLERYASNNVVDPNKAYYWALAALDVSSKMLAIDPILTVFVLRTLQRRRQQYLTWEEFLEIEAIFTRELKFLLVPCSIEYVWEGIIDAEMDNGVDVTVDMLEELYTKAYQAGGNMGYLSALNPTAVANITKLKSKA